MITGCLQKKNGYYYAVLYLKVDGKRKTKWIATKLPVEGTSEKKAKKAFDEIRLQYELDLEKEQKAEGQANCNSESQILFSDYLVNWLKSIRSTIAITTYQSYSNMISARIGPYFNRLGVALNDVTPQQIEDFYQTILDDGCTPNTVIHHHAVIRKALQSAVKKEIINKNPADKVEKPKKNVFVGSHYSQEEMKQLFSVIKEDPLELCIKIAAYYGLRRSEILGLKWSAIDFTQKTISINHKLIEAEVDGKFIPLGEDMLKTKSSFRTLPLIPEIEELLLEQKKKTAIFQELFKNSYSKQYLEYVFVDQSGKIFRPNYVSEHFSWILKKNNLKKIRFHDLRHSCASLLLSKGISMKQIQIWLGHSDFSTTANIYAHLDAAAHEESAATISSIFQE